ncbi:MAG: glycosyltransferase [Rubrivivax sp.]|nr:glycosyltransferase [Pyrinomonadaceae bacterium]
MRALRVLITNCVMSRWTGTELFARDLALDLLRRGHTPVIYTSEVGELAARLRAATIPVTDDLGTLSVPPDIIHGQHHVETMTALLHFGDVPALFYCHGWLPWEERPPRHPRIYRHVAADDTCRDRLLWEGGVAEERTRVVLNGVDLERFRPRPQPLPTRPRRALVFSNDALKHGGAVREACERAGVSLDLAGKDSGRVAEEPEKILGQYDLVFAKGRSALEALAVGAAVVLCDAVGSGPMVTTEEVARLRRLNFGVRALQTKVCAASLAREISRYDAADAAEVSRRVRADADQGRAFDEIVSLYHEIIEEHRATASDAAAEGRAAAAYLRWAMTRAKSERAEFENSAAGRLRQWAVGAPLLGPMIKAAGKRLRESKAGRDE